jgi:hypothetical protein
MATEEKPGAEADPIAQYDRAHGTTKLTDTQRPSGLTEAGNKGPATPGGEPFKNLKSE